MNGMKRFATATSLALVASLLTAQERKQPTKAPNNQPRTVELRRNAAASNIEGTARLVYDETGKRTLECNATIPKFVGKSSGTVECSADPVTGTFTINRRDLDEEEAAFAQTLENSVAPEPDEAIHFHDANTTREKGAPDVPGPGGEEEGCACDEYGGECQGTVNSWIHSRQDGFAKLTKTTATGGWKRYESYITQTCKWVSTGGTAICVGAKPASNGQWWNNDGPCYRYGPVATFPDFWELSARSKYREDDYSDRVDDLIKATFDNDVLSFWTDHSDYGIDMHRIDAIWSYTSNNGCGW